MSGVFDNLLVNDTTRFHLSDRDMKRIERECDSNFFKRHMWPLLTASAVAYHTIDDADLLAYLKGAVYRFKHLQVLRSLAFFAADSDELIYRHTREMRRCNQVICRIQRERTRRIVADNDAKLRE